MIRLVLVLTLLVGQTVIIRNKNDPDNPTPPQAGLCTAAETAGTARYVRAGASGTGSGTNWTDATPALPSVLVRGRIYCVADGTYSSGYTFDDAVSGTTLISVVKATVSDHGISTGWDNTYGDGQAVFTSLTFDTSYIVVDGQVGGGPGSWDSGHGFKIEVRTVSQGGQAAKAMRFQEAASNITVRHLECTAETGNSTASEDYDTACVYAHGEFISPNNNLTFQYVYFHDIFGPPFHIGIGANGLLLEYSKVGDFTGTGPTHSEIISAQGNDELTVRYSWLYSWRSTGGFICHNGPDGGTGDGNVCEDWQIYGNIFEQADGAASQVLNAQQDASNDGYARRWKIFNNTFIDLNSSSTGVNFTSLATTGEANNEIYNNVACGNSDTLTTSDTHNYNSVWNPASGHFDGANDENITSIACTDIFTNYAGADYTLKATHGLANGVDTSAIVAGNSTDMLGRTRGAGGMWSRGAFQVVP